MSGKENSNSKKPKPAGSVKKTVNVGGAAADGGFDFQHHLTAWAATHILAEQFSSPPWQLAPSVSFDWIRCETSEPVDDLMIVTSEGGVIFAQAKRSLSLSTSTDSDLYKSLEQFVRQVIECKKDRKPSKAWTRPLTKATDRLLLATTDLSPSTIRVDLQNALDRVRALAGNESINDISCNQGEAKALKVAREHISRAWKEETSEMISLEQEKEILALAHVHVYFFENNSTELQSKNLLRQCVLKDSRQVNIAWEQLVSMAADLSTNRASIDRAQIQSLLNENETLTYATPSYQRDIQTLNEYSKSTIKSLEFQSCITVGDTKISLKRAIDEEIKNLAELQSFLIIGEPGAGKSATLHKLATSFALDERDYVVLAVDRISATSFKDFESEIGINHDVIDILTNWPGNARAFLLIDALDAARNISTAVFLRDLLNKVTSLDSRWHVIASIRKFDLRYDSELRRQFKGSLSAEFQDSEFVDYRHINVPVFTELELKQIQGQSSSLWKLITDASPRLSQLLKVPFNLRLAADLLNDKVPLESLNPLRTQLELLNEYWKNKVVGQDGYADARSSVLTDICKAMVAEQSLQIPRSVISSTQNSTHLHKLLQLHVLLEYESEHNSVIGLNRLSFAHHYIFDYAVARLILGATANSCLTIIENKSDYLLSIRPSITIYFRLLWFANSDKNSFWKTVFDFLSSEIPEIGKIIGLSVASELATEISELNPLIRRLSEADKTAEISKRALRDLASALVVRDVYQSPIVSNGRSPWCHFLQQLAIINNSDFVFYMQRILSCICQYSTKLEDLELQDAGEAARYLLTKALKEFPNHRWLSDNAIISVCNTFRSLPGGSIDLLKQLLDEQNIQKTGSRNLYSLARELDQLIPLASDFAADVYLKAFNYVVTPEETYLNESQILGLRSTSQQDHDMVLYLLSKNFQNFLDSAETNAVITAVKVTQIFVDKRAGKRETEPKDTKHFEFMGLSAEIQEDISRIWDAGDIYDDNYEVIILNVFTAYLEKLSAKDEGLDNLRNTVRLIATHNRAAVIWSRLLKTAVNFPYTLGQILLPLLKEFAILSCPDTLLSTSKLLSSLYPTLVIRQRLEIENAILELTKEAPPESRLQFESIRNKLLATIPRNLLQNPESQTLMDELAESKQIPTIEDYSITEWSEPYTEEMHLASLGIDTDDPDVITTRKLEEPVRTFADKFINSPPSIAEIDEIAHKIANLHLAVKRIKSEKFSSRIWATLASAAARIARNSDLKIESYAGELAVNILTLCSTHENPVLNLETERQFDESPSWGGPLPRIEAAEGVIYLFRLKAFQTPRIDQCFKSLIADPVAAVRYQIITRLYLLSNNNEEKMWQFLEQVCTSEASNGVLQGLFAGPLYQLANKNPDRVAQLCVSLFERITAQNPGAKKVRNSATQLLTLIYVWNNCSIAESFALSIAAQKPGNSSVNYLLVTLRDPLTLEPIDGTEEETVSIQNRAFKLFEILTTETLSQLTEWRNKEEKSDSQNAEDPQIGRKIAEVIDSISMEINISARELQRRLQNPKADIAQSKKAAQNYYLKMRPLIRKLAESNLPSATHNLVQAIESLITVVPQQAFLDLGFVVQASKIGGYQFEPLAKDTVVAITERFLSEFPDLLKEQPECRIMLVQILDIFVEAGWPEAAKLTFNLEDIFR